MRPPAGVRSFAPPIARVPRGDLLLILAVLAPAAALRLWHLDAVGFRGDEAVYAGQAAVLAGRDGMERWFILSSRGNSNFLVFQGILSVVYRVFGVNDLSARLVSAAFSILTVGVVYAIGRMLYGRAAGFFAALVLGLSGYAVGLGRLALLDSAFTFFCALTVACLLLFHRRDRAGWLYAFVACAALAMQTKVVGVLLLPVAVPYAIVTGTWRRLTPRRILIATAVGLVALTPVWARLSTGDITNFLSSTSRSSGVPWYFFYSVLFSHEGLALTAVYGAGLVWAAVRPSRADLLPVLWLVVVLIFLQAYPLKGYNYLLPVMPALALLSGRAAAEAWHRLLGWWATDRSMLRRTAAGLGACGVAGVLVAGSAPNVAAAVDDDSSAGLREAAYWLDRHGAARDGVMTISHGSAQYVLSFYGGVDAYPFGRFQLATVMPGGEIVPARGGPLPDSGPPRDWLNYWPARLIDQGAVSYFVYYTGHLDDPPTQEQLTGTMSHRLFRALIQRYGGELVHRVYWDHEPRVFIYKVTKRFPYPVLQLTVTADQIIVTGQGFVADSAVTATYHGRTSARGRADHWGRVALTMPLPPHRRSSYHLVVTDEQGNDGSAIGLPETEVDYRLANGRVHVDGSGYTPGGTVTVSYHGRQVGRVVAGERGGFSFAFPPPGGTTPGGAIKATDRKGNTASVVGAAAPVRDRYLVRPGDTLWSIAEDTYGSGESWRRIWSHNDALRSGGTPSDPDRITAGLELDLPTEARRPATRDDAASPGAGR